ncbi:MAG TPA: monovalent cation/H+ antiporter complex subunit F [Candidatus Limnocylindrales bacterium]|jgi:multicomponent Na+:H+ antiporter subunit F|nr:monovalent cation/H+ antiporter complex subunit F [Candidatus Limnocylindrales bacterium]
MPDLAEIDYLATGGLIALSMVSLALFLSAMRLFRGPTLADRVVALELIASLMVGVVAIVAVISDQAVLIDVAIAVTLVGFLGAVGLARYMEKGTTRRGQTE